MPQCVEQIIADMRCMAEAEVAGLDMEKSVYRKLIEGFADTKRAFGGIDDRSRIY